MQIDLSELTLSELKKLKSNVDQAIESFQARALAKARKELEEKAKSLGFTLEEIVQTKKVRTKAQPKYRDPNDANQTWTGRGRKPQWVVDALENGADIDSLAI